jgi:diguanylate cyclase (GGDEF)-like protein
MSIPLLGPRRRDSLATKIILFVFASTLVTAVTVSGMAVHATYSAQRSALEHSQAALLTGAATHLGSWIERGQGVLGTLAGQDAFRRALRGRAGPARARLAAELGPFAGLALIDREGAVRARAGDLAAPVLPGAAAALTLGTADGQLVAAVPVLDAGGERLGTLTGAFDPAGLRDHLAAAVDHGGGSLHLVDAAGTALLGPLGSDEAPLEGIPPESLGPRGHPSLFEVRGRDGRLDVASAQPLDGLDWWLVVAEPADRAFAPVYAVVSRVFALDLMVILAFSLLAYEVTAQIVRPIEALCDGARRISQGDLGVNIPERRTQDELGLLTRTFNDMTHRLRRNRDELDDHHRQLRERNEELQRANEVLEQLSITDGLTKLHNHRYFQETLTREIKRASRIEQPLAMLLVDIDDFKRLNDQHGHAEGDAILARIARILNSSVRESDLLARYGGEEFVVLATGTELAGAVLLGEKIRTAVAETEFLVEQGRQPVRITVSVGVACFGGDRRRFFDDADRALYRAKAEGKNCVVAAQDPA